MRLKFFLSAAMLAFAATVSFAAESGLQKGSPAVKSISALAFGPNGILFIGDPAGGSIHAIDTGDTKAAGSADVAIDKLDEKIGSALGVTGKDVVINDVKVNGASGNIFIAATRAKASTPVILKLTRDGNLSEVSLKDVPSASVKLPNVEGAKTKTASDIITGLAFIDGKLVVAGLSNEEFASTLRLIPFPFQKADRGAGVEIFHGAHGKIETHSPVRTFTPFKASGADYIIASYTCTPLVRIPLSELKDGAKVKGTTIAELGNRNRPLDMIAYSKGGKDYLLMANSARGVMKIPTDTIATQTAITSRPQGEKAGVSYDTISELKDVVQLDRLDDGRALVLIAPQGGSATLKSIPLP